MPPPALDPLLFSDYDQLRRFFYIFADDGPDTVLNMVQNSVTVATTTIETPTLIRIAYTGG